jgi:Leucine-rich repeat (LRR) protein
MRGLYSLNLSNNALTSTIPAEIRNLQNLGNLDLHSNHLKGPITAVFSMESRSPEGNFEIVDLSHNKFTGSIPLKVGDQKQMEQLVLSHNSLSGAIPSSVGMMQRLKVLDLSSNILSGSIPNTLGSLAQLNTLELNENRLSGGIPNAFLNLTSLLQLNLSHNSLSGRIPHGILLLKFPISSYSENSGLCGDPLPDC